MSSEAIQSKLDVLLGCTVQELSGENLNACHFGERLFYQFHKGVHLRFQEDQYLFFNGSIIESESGLDHFFLQVKEVEALEAPHMLSRLFYRSSLTMANNRLFIVEGYELHGLALENGTVQPFALILKDALGQQLNIRFEFPADGLHVSFGQEEWETFFREDPFGRKLKCMYSI